MPENSYLHGFLDLINMNTDTDIWILNNTDTNTDTEILHWYQKLPIPEVFLYDWNTNQYLLFIKSCNDEENIRAEISCAWVTEQASQAVHEHVAW